MQTTTAVSYACAFKLSSVVAGLDDEKIPITLQLNRSEKAREEKLGRRRRQADQTSNELPSNDA